MSVPTLTGFFGFAAEEPSDQQVEQIRGHLLQANLVAFAGRPPGEFWRSLARAVSRAVGPALTLSLQDVLVGGWNTLRSLREYGDRSKHPREEVGHLSLGKHTITSKHQPKVELSVGGVTVLEIPFDVELSLRLDGFILTIQDRKLREIATGRCIGEGTLKLGGAILAKRVTEPVVFPGRISLGEGIAIPFVRSEGDG